METRTPYADLDSSRATPASSPAPGVPGKRSMTQGMAPRTVIYRAAERDANGVAADAEAAVARASGGSGAALPSRVQRQFEQSLGTDLSAVRVHTGAESAQAASAVGAKAYTVGNDIHFAEGRYQPDDPFGLHLLAHEVAHTAQQSGGAQRRQHKLEVSAPQDAAEHEADRAADAMVAGRPAAVSGASAGAIARDLDLDDGWLTDAYGTSSGPWAVAGYQPPPPPIETPPPVLEVLWNAVGPTSSDLQDAWSEAPAFAAGRATRTFEYSSAAGPLHLEQDVQPYLDAFSASWSAAQSSYNAGGAAIQRYLDAPKDPVANGLTGAGQLVTDAELAKNPNAAGKSMGVLQRDSFASDQDLGAAVAAAQPMATPSSMTIGRATDPNAPQISQDSSSGDLAANATKGVGANQAVQDAMLEYQKSQVALDEASKNLADGADSSGLEDAVKQAERGVKAAELGQESAANAEEKLKVEANKGHAESIVNMLRLLMQPKLTDDVMEIAGAVVAGEFDNVLRTYDATSARITSELAAISSEDARAALAGAQASLKAFGSRIAGLKNKVVVADNARRAALNKLSKAAADNSLSQRTNANDIGEVVAMKQAEAEAVRVKINALPAVEVVVAALEGITGAIAIPAYSTASGQGASQATNLASFTDHLSQLAGAKIKYAELLAEWKAKKASIVEFINSGIM